ncbi:MAG TPA: TM2 domain-containing protein [Gemmatimonadales bacterium]|nr:TM2 domain-containing protein [Gemmatimonadales bacterium]
MTSPIPYDDEPQDDEGERLPANRPKVSEQSRGVALVLAIFGGWVGLHRFYTGRWKTGLAMAITMGGFGIWWVYDLILIGAGEFRDANQLRLSSWETTHGQRALPSREVEVLMERVDSLERDLGEMAERLDFTERMLSKERDRRSLPPSS